MPQNVFAALPPKLVPPLQRQRSMEGVVSRLLVLLLLLAERCSPLLLPSAGPRAGVPRSSALRAIAATPPEVPPEPALPRGRGQASGRGWQRGSGG